MKLDVKPNNWEQRLILFVGYLIQCNKKSTTVCRVVNDQVTSCLPIQRLLLQSILYRTQVHYSDLGQIYLCKLYRALFASVYFGLLRVDKITSGSHPVFATDVQIAQNKKKIKFVLHTSKTHWKDSEPQIVIIKNIKDKSEKQSENLKNTVPMSHQSICPYSILREHVNERPSCKSLTEPFFVFRDRTPVSPKNVRDSLHLMLKLSGFDQSLYCIHSLPAGMACDLLKMGYSVETIKKLGRWRSNIVYKYLR